MAFTADEKAGIKQKLDLAGGTGVSDALVKMDAVGSTAAEIDNVADVSAVPVRRWFAIDISAPADGSETDTGFFVPASCLIHNIVLDVTTAEVTGGTKTLDIGLDGTTSNDPDGLAVGLDCSSVGLVQPSLLEATSNYGALLEAVESGTDLVPEAHVVNAETDANVTITAGSADWAEFVGKIYLDITDFSGVS